MTTKNKPIGMLIMILALVLVAVILVIVIVASANGEDETTPVITTTQTPTSTTDETPTSSTTPTSTADETPTSSTTPVEVTPPVPATTLKADESGKITLPSTDASTGLLIDVSETNPYNYDLENIFKGDHETSQEDIAKSDYKRLVSASDYIMTPGWTHYVRKDTYTAMLAMITTFNAQSGTLKAIQVSGYTASMSESVTNPFITGNVISLLGHDGTGTLGLNYSINKVTVNGVSMTFDKWFEAYAASYGFVFEGLSGSDYLKKGTLRYVGTIHAAGVSAAGSLSAYLAGIKDGTITTATASDGSTWNLSYVAASSEETTEITVGANATYTVSGDNMGGFIVAVSAK